MGRLPRLKFTQSDISLKHLKYHFITGYEFILKAVLGLQHNSAIGILKKLKKYFGNAWAMTGWRRIP
jgi:hypothetical protein